MHKLLIDTDVLIDFSKGKSSLLKELLGLQSRSKAVLYTTPVNLAEYLNDIFLVNKNRFITSLEYLENFKTLNIGKKSGILAGGYLRLKLTPSIGDALIAGVCVENNLELVTRNKKHFQKIPNLKIFEEDKL